MIWPPAPNPIQLSGFDESKHPRDDDGKFGEGASVKDVAGAIAQDLGLELDLSPIKGEDAFILRKIVVPESERGKGSGSKANNIGFFSDDEQLKKTMAALETKAEKFAGKLARKKGANLSAAPTMYAAGEA